MPIIYTHDPTDPRLDPYLRLTDRQLRSLVEPANAQMICESRLVIEVALDQGLAPRSLFVDERHLPALADVIARIGPDVPVYAAPIELMSKVTGYHVTRGFLACFPRPVPPDAGALLDALPARARVAVLEDVVDVTNVGAIFRSAAALGADAVLLAPRCADPLSRRALRVSMGTILQVPWAFLPEPWPKAAADALRARGFSCAALALDRRALPLDDPVLKAQDRLALFFGTEGTGLTPAALAACDRTVIIPMRHGVDSLNVAASAAVAFWELCR